MKLFISFTRQIRRNKSPFFLIFSFRKKRRDTFVEIPPILTEGARINRGEGKKKKNRFIRTRKGFGSDRADEIDRPNENEGLESSVCGGRPADNEIEPP